MQQRQIIACDNGTFSAQWICINHKTFICDICRKDHENCKILTIDEFHQKFSDLLKQRSQQIDEGKKLVNKMKSLKNSTQGLIILNMSKLIEKFNSIETVQVSLKEQFCKSLLEYEQQNTKEKLQAMLKYIELKGGNIILINDFGAIYQQLKQQLNEYINEIKDVLDSIQRTIQQQNDQQQQQRLQQQQQLGQQQQNDDDSSSDSSSSDWDEQQNKETQIKSPQNIINYEPAIAYLLRARDQKPDPTQLYQEDYQKIKFLLEIRENYVIATSRLRVFLIQLQPPVVRSILSFRQEKITSISKFQNQDQYKFIIAQENGVICIINSNNDKLELLKREIICDQPGRLLIGLSENILVTVGGNHRIRYYLPDLGQFDGISSVEGRNFIRKPPRCLLVLNDNINFIAVAGAQDLFIIRNQIELENLHTVNQRNSVKFLGYSKNTQDNKNDGFLYAVVHKKVYIYDLKNHNLRKYLQFPYTITYFQVINNRCLVNCSVEAEVNGFRAYQIHIREQLENMQKEVLQDVRNKNIKLAKLQEINQRFVFQIFIVENIIVRRESINI